MGYQSRRRGYKSRREKLARSRRDLSVVFIFAFLALLVYAFMRRVDLIAYLEAVFS